VLESDKNEIWVY